MKILSSILRRWPVPTPCKRVRELKGYRRRPETIFIRLKIRFCHFLSHLCVFKSTWSKEYDVREGFLPWPSLPCSPCSLPCSSHGCRGDPLNLSKSKCRIQVGNRRFQFANKSTFIAPLLLHVKCFVLLQKIHLDGLIVITWYVFAKKIHLDGRLFHHCESSPRTRTH